MIDLEAPNPTEKSDCGVVGCSPPPPCWSWWRRGGARRARLARAGRGDDEHTTRQHGSGRGDGEHAIRHDDCDSRVVVCGRDRSLRVC